MLLKHSPLPLLVQKCHVAHLEEKMENKNLESCPAIWQNWMFVECNNCNFYVFNFIFLVLHCITVSVWNELRGKDLIIHPRHLEKHCFTAFSHHVSLVSFRFNSLVSSMMAAIHVIVTQVIFLSEWMKEEMPQTQKN